LCKSVFSIHHGGRNVIEKHICATKHKESLAAKALSRITFFFVGIIIGKKVFDLAAKERTFTFHTVTENQSFQLMDCTSTFVWKLFEPESTCAQTKVQAIVVNVLAPLIINQTREETDPTCQIYFHNTRFM
jgi:hypothetical protein